MKKYPSNISIEVTQEKGYILPKGYSWDVKMVKGMKEGKVTVKDKMKLVHAVLFYSHDKLNGICSFYDKGRLIEKRTYVDNVANGWACEYEKSKEVRWFIYKNGKKESILGKCEEKDGYWKETCIDSHSLITVCQYDKNHKKNAFFFYNKERRPLLAKEQPSLNNKEIISTMSKEWNALSEEKKKPYNKMAEDDKKRYEDEKAKYEKKKGAKVSTTKS